MNCAEATKLMDVTVTKSTKLMEHSFIRSARPRHITRLQSPDPPSSTKFKRRKHFINLFIWPTTPEDSTAQTMVEREGYHLVHWSDGDFTYWAVSDVNVDDLQKFQAAV